MAYSDQKYYTRSSEVIADAKTANGTATASGTNTLTSGIPLPAFTRKTQINSGQIIVVTAPKINKAYLRFLNGTNTFATATVSSTAAAGSSITIVLTNTASVSTNTYTNTAPNGSTVVLTNTTTTNWAVIGSGTTPTCNVVTDTSTASADTWGAYEVFFENQEATV